MHSIIEHCGPWKLFRANVSTTVVWNSIEINGILGRGFNVSTEFQRVTYQQLAREVEECIPSINLFSLQYKFTVMYGINILTLQYFQLNNNYTIIVYSQHTSLYVFIILNHRNHDFNANSLRRQIGLTLA